MDYIVYSSGSHTQISENAKSSPSNKLSICEKDLSKALSKIDLLTAKTFDQSQAEINQNQSQDIAPTEGINSDPSGKLEEEFLTSSGDYYQGEDLESLIDNSFYELGLDNFERTITCKKTVCKILLKNNESDSSLSMGLLVANKIAFNPSLTEYLDGEYQASGNGNDGTAKIFFKRKMTRF